MKECVHHVWVEIFSVVVRNVTKPGADVVLGSPTLLRGGMIKRGGQFFGRTVCKNEYEIGERFIERPLLKKAIELPLFNSRRRRERECPMTMKDCRARLPKNWA